MALGWNGVFEKSGWLALALLLFVPDAMARTIDFAGMQWEVKNKPGHGPGNGCWSDSERSVSVDPDGRLHLRSHKTPDGWCQAEVSSVKPARFGDHLFQIITSQRPVHEFDPNVVIAMFLYADDDHEIDIELTRSFSEPDLNGWHVVQRNDSEGNVRQGFSFEASGSHTSHLIRWREGRVEFISYHGHCDEPPCGGIISQWQYIGEHVPHEDDGLNTHLQIWINNGGELAEAQEVTISAYRGPDRADEDSE